MRVYETSVSLLSFVCDDVFLFPLSPLPLFIGDLTYCNRKFVSDLTDVCEQLRFVEDRSKRGAMLESLLMKVHVPECSYLPLCRSTEPFQRVLKITANEAKAFSTKVYCCRDTAV